MNIGSDTNHFESIRSRMTAMRRAILVFAILLLPALMALGQRPAAAKRALAIIEYQEAPPQYAPEFKIRIFADGQVEFEGIRVRQKGVGVGRISTPEINTLLAKARSINFDSMMGRLTKVNTNPYSQLSKSEQVICLDATEYVISIHASGLNNRVQFDCAYPKELDELSSLIKEKVNIQQWIFFDLAGLKEAVANGYDLQGHAAYLSLNAIEWADPAILEYLIHGRTRLESTFCWSHELQDQRHKRNGNCDGVGYYEVSLLFSAADAGCRACVDLLLSQGFSPNESIDMGIVPLHAVSRRHGAEIATLLIDKGADVNAKNENGWTPLMYASRYGSLDVVRVLIDRGAQINAKDSVGRTALGHAKEELQNAEKDSNYASSLVKTIAMLEAAGAR